MRSNLKNPNILPVRYTVAIAEGSAEVCGVITVRGHYFEDGNIQLQTSKEVGSKSVPFSVSVFFFFFFTGPFFMHAAVGSFQGALLILRVRAVFRKQPLWLLCLAGPLLAALLVYSGCHCR